MQDRKTYSEFIKELTELLQECIKENHRLSIENGLLRKASEVQRELNGKLRLELQQNESYYSALDNRS